MADIAVRASSSNSANSGSAISVSAPTGVQIGDVVIVVVHGNTDTTIVDNNGSTPFTEDLNDYHPNSSSGHTVSIFSRRIQSGDPSTYNFTLGSSGRWAAIAVAMSDVNTSSIYDVSIFTENVDASDSGSLDIDSITTLTDKALHFVGLAWDTGATGTITLPSGYTDVSSIATNQPVALCYKQITPAGATGNKEISNTEFGARIGFAFAIKNAVAPGSSASSSLSPSASLSPSSSSSPSISPSSSKSPSLSPSASRSPSSSLSPSQSPSISPSLSPSEAVISIHKHYYYKVYQRNGAGYTYISTWSDEVFSDPRFKTNINNGASDLTIKLARSFDEFGEDVDVRLGNKVDVYVVDKEQLNGQLIYSGYISGYKPVIRAVEEYIEIVLFSFNAQFQRMILRDVSGNTTVTYNSYDPANILKDVINRYRALGGTINYTATSIDLTNTEVSYTFNTNTIKECVDKIIELCPIGWYFRIDPDNTIYLKPKHDTPDHTFIVSKHIENLETFRRIEDIVNRVLFTGGGSPNLFRKYENTASQEAYGLFEIKIVDERVTNTSTAQTMANREINTKKDPEVRSILTIVDSNTLGLFGYDIESVKVGETMNIKGLKVDTTQTKWDISEWDTDVWDSSLSASSVAVVQILSVDYTPDSLVIEASSRIPQIAKRIEDINRNLENSQTFDNPVAPV